MESWNGYIFPKGRANTIWQPPKVSPEDETWELWLDRATYDLTVEIRTEFNKLRWKMK